MNKYFILLYTGLILIIFPLITQAQIQILEAERSDSTAYTVGSHQDSVYIVYKGANNISTITLTAGLNNIDSLNFAWSKYNYASKQFESLISFDTVQNCTISYDNPNTNMNDYEGGYKVNIYNSKKGIDTSFVTWVWYQDFFINKINIEYSTCRELRLNADTSFQASFSYADLSVGSNNFLTLENEAEFVWTTDIGDENDKWFSARPIFPAPVEETNYELTATDSYGYSWEPTFLVYEDLIDDEGYPIMRAVKTDFSARTGIESEENLPISALAEDSVVSVEAPHGVAFYNNSKNGDSYEWVFYQHIDWRRNIYDTALLVSDLFDFRTDSIFYERPPRDTLNSPEGYDVKLTTKGPVYNVDGDQCWDSLRHESFIVVTPTKFPKKLEELPNVFTPDGSYERFYFISQKNGENEIQASSDVKSLRYFSIKIYNRWGNKVYEYEDNDGSWIEEDGKRGWDGTTRVGTQAKPGVYYYAILATGWDNREFEVGGYVHIF